jgi:O-antigen ligase
VAGPAQDRAYRFVQLLWRVGIRVFNFPICRKPKIQIVIPAINRVFIFFFTAVFLTAVGCYAYWQHIYFLFIPFGLIAAIYLIQHPEYLFYTLVASIPWSVEFNFSSGLGTDLPDEPLMLLSSFAVLALLAYRGKKSATKIHPLILLLGIQFLWLIITVASSTDILLSVKYLLAKSWYLLAFVGAPLFLFADRKILKKSALLLTGSMLVFMLLALVRHWQNGWTFENINKSLEPFYRNHVNYSALLVFMAPLQVAILQLSSSKKIRAVFICTLVLTMAALYLSFARGAWLALLTGLAAYWLLKRRLLVFGFLFFMVFSLGAVLWLKSNDRFLKFSNDYRSTIFHTDFREHLIATYQLKDLSNAERVYRWVAGVRMAKDSWKTGLGPSTFYKQYKSYTLPAFKTYVSRNKEESTVHNYFLLLLIEQGAIGVLLFVALVAFLFWYAQKIYHAAGERFWKVAMAAVAAVLVMECTVNFLSDMIETDKVGSVFYLCVAVIIIGDRQTRKRSDLAADIERVP